MTLKDSLFRRSSGGSISDAGKPITRAGGKSIPVPEARNETLTVDLGNGVNMTFRRIPAGKFRMGNERETPAERPVSTVGIERPFWMGEAEGTLGQ